MDLKKIVRLECKRYTSNKALVFSMILVPMLLIVGTVFFFSYISSGELENTNIAIVNYDTNDDIEIIMSLLKSTESIKENAQLSMFEYDEAIEGLKRQAIDMVVIIPEKFSSNIYKGKNSYIEIIENNNALNKIKTLIFKKVAIEAVSLGVYAEKCLDIVWDSMDESGYSRGEMVDKYNDSAKSLIMNIAGRNKMFNIIEESTSILYFIALFSVLFIYLNGLLIFITMNNDEDNRILERFKVNNIDLKQYILSKFIVSILLQLIMYCLPLAIVMKYLKVLTLSSIMALVIICICSNLIIYTISRVFKKKSITIIVYIVFVIISIINIDFRLLNPLGKSTYLLMDIFNGVTLTRLVELMMFILLIFILNFSINIKNIKEK